MENRIYDENNGLWYARQGDYYLPELALPPEEEKPIGIWGQRHLRYLKEHKQLVYINPLPVHLRLQGIHSACRLSAD